MNALLDETRAPLADGKAALAFLLAGNARLTLRSLKTGTRFTYRVRAKEERAPGAPAAEGGPFFVALLSGSDNEHDYQFLGTIFPKAGSTPVFAHGRKSRIGSDAPSARAFAWAATYLLRGVIPPDCEVWHEGRCGRCGRALTDPESIASGIGPVCGGHKEAA